MRFFETLYHGERYIGLDELGGSKTLKLYKITLKEFIESGKCVGDIKTVRDYLDSTIKSVILLQINLQNLTLLPPLLPEISTDAVVGGFMQTHNVKIDKSVGNVPNIPNWFFKGFGSSLQVSKNILKAPKNPVAICEEAEVVLIYQSDKFGKPQYIGYTFGNDLTDIGCFKRNSGHLAYAKLCDAAISYWFYPSPPPQKVNGEVSIIRDSKLAWQGTFNTGLSALGYDLNDMISNLFSFPTLCSPDRTYYVFLGADKSSYHAGFTIKNQDQVVINFLSHDVIIDNQIQFGFTQI